MNFQYDNGLLLIIKVMSLIVRVKKKFLVHNNNDLVGELIMEYMFIQAMYHVLGQMLMYRLYFMVLLVIRVIDH